MPYLRIKAKAITERDFLPSFRFRLEVIVRRLSQAVGEHGNEDISATYLTSAPEPAA